jgi:hypothetical protein
MKLLRSLAVEITGDDLDAKLFAQTFGRSEELAMTTESSGQRKVIAGATGIAIPFGGVTTAAVILIAVDQDVVVHLNAGSESIVVKKTATGRGLLYLEGTVTAIAVDNLGAADASVVYALAGV